jgi:hypothetical protein
MSGIIPPLVYVYFLHYHKHIALWINMYISSASSMYVSYINVCIFYEYRQCTCNVPSNSAHALPGLRTHKYTSRTKKNEKNHTETEKT